MLGVKELKGALTDMPACPEVLLTLFFFFCLSLVVIRADCSIFRPASSAVVGFSDQPFSLDLDHCTPQLLCGR